MKRIQNIILSLYAIGMLVLLLFIVPLNAYEIRSMWTREGSINEQPKRAYELDKWGTIWDTPNIPVWDRGVVRAFFRPDKERMLLTVVSWTVVCGIAFVLFRRNGRIVGIKL